MAGIYLHIPFCKQKCHYCNFFSIASLKKKNNLFNALLSEIELQKNYLGGETIETIYFGGGTPSLLEGDEINQIIDELAKHHLMVQVPEITLEANPDDLNKEKIRALKKTPVNRMSIGVQSFFDEDLKYLNRIHNADEALLSVKRVMEAGYTNLTIDLIYGIPTLSEENWSQNLETFFSLNLPHLSAYALTVEPKTALDLLISRNKIKPVEEAAIVSHFNLLMRATKYNGFSHYEISNFCREPHFSKHNVSYWSGKKYLGLGPSAHSYNGTSRQWNVSSIDEYNKNIHSGIIPSSNEVLTNDQLYNEYVLTSLRTMWGTDVSIIESRFGTNRSAYFVKCIAKFLPENKVIVKGKKYCLTDEGKLFADGIASELFV
jgi:oxygen-independent coproporphyrinogen-3 oxidase